MLRAFFYAKAFRENYPEIVGEMIKLMLRQNY